MSDSLRILVTGATGQQGGSVVQALLAGGYRIRALSRDPNSERSIALRGRGVDVVQSDFRDRNSLAAALDGVDGAFLMSTPFEAGTQAETEQGVIFVEAARSAKVPHLVYSSVASAEQNTGIPHFDSKYKVEQHIQSLGIPHTIIAPVYFYDNMLAPFVLPGLQHGTLAQSLPMEIGLQSISVRNIGEFAALAFAQKNRFLGRRINIAGDELTGPGYADVIARVSGREITYSEVPIEQVRAMSEDMALMYEWFVRIGYSVPIAELKREYPEVNWESFAEWAARQDWSVLEAS